MRQMIYHFVGHEILNKTVYFVYHFNVFSREIDENFSKIPKNGSLKIQIYEAKDISSCRA